MYMATTNISGARLISEEEKWLKSSILILPQKHSRGNCMRGKEI
jgi:hypothetical protein